ncbi:MAG TPA: RHS repeat-associated core domain-containing protein [Ktedonobacteraceae bacterium]|jgi:RHS repeat-associated protein|nr:RHS repeat-associated core domain-containing protein [Ktedonobacteraceae bacterium]
MVTQFFLTDALGSVLASFSDTPNSAAVLGNQVYGPYGNQRYLKGTMGTAKGYTGQYADPTGLDYYNARYYDPVAGVFLSADSKQGNAQGMNPYAYVAGNPETFTDPTGQYLAGPGGQTYIPGAPYYMQDGEAYQVSTPSHPVKDGTPYTGPGFVNGWRPGQGPNAHPAGQGNPKSVARSSHPNSGASPSSGCDKACGDRDRQLIQDYLNKQKTFWNNVATAIGDGVALAGDIIAAIAHGIAQDWKGFTMELLSALSRGAALVGDLGALGVFKMPTIIVDILTSLKWVANVIDTIGGLLSIFNPVQPVLNEMGQWVVQKARPLIVAAIFQLIAGSVSSAGTVLAPKLMNIAYWDGQIANVDTYSDQQAYTICVQDYHSEPGIC